jgi:hypothetical protein
MYEPRYWSSKGSFQKEYDEMYKRLVPPEGKAATKAGEILRTVSSIYYDQFNNGGWNLEGGRAQDVHGLLYLVPDEKRAEAIRFTTPLSIMSDELSEASFDSWLKELDTFVDWVIQYAAEIENKEGLPC